MIPLARAALRHHRGLTLSLVATVALAAALLVGALVVGDALRAALAARADARLGPVTVVVEAGEGGFRAALADEVADAAGARVAPVLHRAGVLSGPGGAAAVDAYGVDRRLASLADVPDLVPPPGQVRVDAALADRLGVAPGDRLVLRVERPAALSRDVALTQEEGRVVGLSLEVGPLLDGRWPTDLSTAATPGTPDVALVDLGFLQARLGRPGRVDRLLVADAAPEAVRAAVDARWDLADAGLEVRDAGGEAALLTERVLLPPQVASAVVDGVEGAAPGLAWLADRITAGGREVSYAFVGAVPPEADAAVARALPDDLADDEIVLDAWLAERLAVAPGDAVVVRFPVLGRGRAVTYEDAPLRVRAVAPLAGAVADPSWMPPIEGMSGQETCRSWDPGLPVALDRITDDDEAWWSVHGGTPKAWVSLATGRRLWGGPLGDATTVRFPGRDPASAAAEVRAALDATAAGLRVVPVQAQLRAASAPATDFGALFGGFQAVLLGAALLLVALQASFGLEARAAELGTLRALGFSRRRVLGLVAAELGLAAAAGALLGLPLAVGVAALLLSGLEGAWAGATSGLALPLVLRPGTVLAGSALVGLCALGAGLPTAAALLRRSPRALLAGRTPPAPSHARWARVLALVAGSLSAAVILTTPVERTPAAALGFFVGGALLLTAALAALRARWSSGGRPLGAGAAARRPGRSLAVVALLGWGAFLVAGVGLGGGRAAPDPSRRDGGTGGFALWGETVLPVRHDLDDPAGREALGLRGAAPDGVVALRRVDGDDASCLQLGSAQTPTLLGVDPDALARRGAFGDPAVWQALRRDLGPGRVAAVGDTSTVTWGLHLAPGDALTWIDEAGRPVEVVLVDVIGASVLQGALVVDEAALLRHFPTEATARTFLVDAPPEAADAVRAELERALADLGGVFAPTPERLGRFAEVEDTYVGIFRRLGGLGLVLGSLGVGLVLARGVVERRAELAALRAMGFSRGRVRRLLVLEHASLVALGLGTGAAAAGVAVLPILASPEAHAPWGEVAAVLVATGVTAWGALQIAAWRALRAVPLRALTRARR